MKKFFKDLFDTVVSDQDLLTIVIFVILMIVIIIVFTVFDLWDVFIPL